jgi:hypothetical protein
MSFAFPGKAVCMGEIASHRREQRRIVSGSAERHRVARRLWPEAFLGPCEDVGEERNHAALAGKSAVLTDFSSRWAKSRIAGCRQRGMRLFDRHESTVDTGTFSKRASSLVPPN